MIEEQLLERKFGKPRPFKIPDGYFDRINADVMCKIPETGLSRRHPFKKILRPVTWAACIAAVVVSGVICFVNMDDNPRPVSSVAWDNTSQAMYNDCMIEEMTEYAMFDNDDLYSFIADE